MDYKKFTIILKKFKFVKIFEIDINLTFTIRTKYFKILKNVFMNINKKSIVKIFEIDKTHTFTIRTKYFKILKNVFMNIYKKSIVKISKIYTEKV